MKLKNCVWNIQIKHIPILRHNQIFLVKWVNTQNTSFWDNNSTKKIIIITTRNLWKRYRVQHKQWHELISYSLWISFLSFIPLIISFFFLLFFSVEFWIFRLYNDQAADECQMVPCISILYTYGYLSNSLWFEYYYYICIHTILHRDIILICGISPIQSINFYFSVLMLCPF